MKIIYFFKVFKISCRFETWNENSENVFGFWDNCIWSNSGKMSLLRREYMWLPVNLLKHSPKISDLAKGDLSVLDLPGINGKLASKHRRDTFQHCFRPVNSLTWKRCFEAGAFVHSRKHILRCQKLRKYSSYVVHLLFQTVQNLI